MDFYSGSGSRKFISFRLDNEMSGQPTQDNVEAMETDQPQLEQPQEPEVIELRTELRSIIELSSTTDSESCEAYFTRKIECLTNSEEDVTAATTTTSNLVRASESEPVAVTPGFNEMMPDTSRPVDVPEVVFLDKATAQTAISEVIDSNFATDETPVLESHTGQTTLPEGQTVQQSEVTPATNSTDEYGDVQGQMDYRSQTEDESCPGMDIDTGSMARSTLAQALYSPSKPGNVSLPQTSSQDTSDPLPHDSRGPTPLFSTSRLIIKQCFEERNPTYLSPGHMTVAFNQDQISSILRIVADESARASYEMLNSVVVRASRLSLHSPRGTTSRKHMQEGPHPCTDTDVGNDSVMTYDTRGGDSSPEFTSDPESNRDFQSSVALPVPPTYPRENQLVQENSPVSFDCSSPGTETLAALRQEAIKEKEKGRLPPQVQPKPKRPSRPRRRIGRIMKEEYFDSMPWTRVFVSGPLDPKWNPNKSYCQICKCNVSIKAKGPKEILRHYANERHLRKDQRWRYEYLPIEDPITKKLRHHVRGKDRKILPHYQLRLELPLFINAELVDIGEKLPFYEEAMSGAGHMASSPQNRARIQISILGHYLLLSGDISVLQTLSQYTGTVVNYQALFADIDWSTAKLSVSGLHVAYILIV